MAEAVDRREQILEAAFGEFAVEGYRGATIKSIARAAGLQSPALIYHYFSDKEALFREVLESRAPILRTISDPASLMELEPEELLSRVGRAFLRFRRPENRRLVRLMIGEAARRPEVAEMLARRGPMRVLGFLESYLERQVEIGRLRPHDVRSGARAFMGMLVPQVAGRTLLPALGVSGPTDEEHLAASVSIFLEGLRAGS